MRSAPVSSLTVSAIVIAFATTHVSTQEFGYYGEIGPSFWSSLSPEWSACNSGEIQSPVDFGRVRPGHPGHQRRRFDRSAPFMKGWRPVRPWPVVS